MKLSKFLSLLLSLIFLIAASGCKKENKSDQITDIDGNIYHSISIGTQTWMVENLKTTKFNDGTAIPNVTDPAVWYGLSSSACGVYNNDDGYVNLYGRLYNGFAVKTGKLAPKGWHVPTMEEWETLLTFLGDRFVAGGKLKEAGSAHWASPNIVATSVNGFRALPGGFRYNAADSDLGISGYWWTTTESNPNMFSSYRMDSNSAQVLRYIRPYVLGYSVRCIKD